VFGSFDYEPNTSRSTTSGYSGSKGYTLTGRTPKGALNGFSYHASFDRVGLASSYQELYYRYRVLFKTGYQWTNTSGRGGGKLPGLAGKSTGGNMTNHLDKRVGSGGQRWNGTTEVDRYHLADADGWSARLLWEKDGALSSYVYAVSPVGASSSKSYYGYVQRCKIPGTNTAKLFTKGAWNTVELHVKMNTPGYSNGILQVWMNGVMCIDQRNIQYRSSKRTTLGITQQYVAWTYGGPTSDAPSNDSWIYFDDAVLSKAYIGPRQS
jgi:hypothetical protein